MIKMRRTKQGRDRVVESRFRVMQCPQSIRPEVRSKTKMYVNALPSFSHKGQSGGCHWKRRIYTFTTATKNSTTENNLPRISLNTEVEMKHCFID